MTRETVEAQILNAASEAVLFLTALVRGDVAYGDDAHLRTSAAITLLETAGYRSDAPSPADEIIVEYIPE